jgi:hypothetical protein
MAKAKSRTAKRTTRTRTRTAKPRALPNLDRLDLKTIVARAQAEQLWSDSQAREAELWYRRFLQLSRERARGPFYAIDETADHLWHAHILFTRKYRADCERFLGGYLDHTPATAVSNELSEERRARAEALYKKAFGDAPPFLKVPCYVPPTPPGPPGRPR